jgi:hypothetical protein
MTTGGDTYKKKWGLYQSPNKKGESVNPPYQVYAVFSCGKKFNQSLKNVFRPDWPENVLDGSSTIINLFTN